MSGETLNYKKHLSLQIGHYCQVHEEGHPRNSQLARTKGAISRTKWKSAERLQVHGSEHRKEDCAPQLGCNSHAGPRQMTFTDRHGRLIGDIEIPGVDSDKEQEDHLPGVAPVIDDDIEIPGVDVAGPEALDEAPAPQVEINDLVNPQDNPDPIEVAPPQESAGQEMPTPDVTTVHAQGIHLSNRVRTQTKQAYTPSMTGSKYSYAVT
jgi:hypothetical protein